MYQIFKMISEKMIDMERKKVNFNFPMHVSNKGNTKKIPGIIEYIFSQINKT